MHMLVLRGLALLLALLTSQDPKSNFYAAGLRQSFSVTSCPTRSSLTPTPWNGCHVIFTASSPSHHRLSQILTPFLVFSFSQDHCSTLSELTRRQQERSTAFNSAIFLKHFENSVYRSDIYLHGVISIHHPRYPPQCMQVVPSRINSVFVPWHT
jgi:hypothetical protein